MIISLIALMLLVQAPSGPEPVPGPDEVLGHFASRDHQPYANVLTRSALTEYALAGEDDAAFAAALAAVLANEPRAHSAALLRHGVTGGYLLILDAPGAGETWRSGALTWPLLQTGEAWPDEGAPLRVMYRNHAPDLPDFAPFCVRETAE
jgi:hypothetical protein